VLGATQHQQEMDDADPRLEGSTEPIYDPIRGKASSAVNPIAGYTKICTPSWSESASPPSKQLLRVGRQPVRNAGRIADGAKHLSDIARAAVEGFIPPGRRVQQVPCSVE